MPVFELTSPEGTKFRVTAPEGTTEQQALARVQQEYGKQKESFLSSFGGGLIKGAIGGGSSSEPQMPYETEEQFQGREATPQELERQYPTPKSLSGRIAQGVGEGVASPLNLLGPLGRVATAGRLISGAVAGVGSELAGAASKDNPVARAVGGVVGGLVPRAVGRAVSPSTIRLERVQPLSALRAAGVEPTAGDVLGSTFVRQLEKQGDKFLGGQSYVDLKTEAMEQYTRAVSRSIGENVPRVDGDVLRRVQNRLGNSFESVANRLPITQDPKLGNDLTQIEQDVFRFGHTDEVHRRVSALIQHVNNGFVTNRRNRGVMDGGTYQGVTRHGEGLNRAIEDTNPNIGYFAGRIRTALDDAMERSVTNAVKNAFSRGQPTGPARARAIDMANALRELRETRRQWYNMRVLSKSLAGPGEATSQGLILPERLRSNLSSGADNKVSYAASRSDLHQLAQAGTAILEPHHPPGWGEWAAGHAVGTGLGFLAGGPAGAATGVVSPGIIGRLTNSRAAQAYLKNQRAIRLLNQLNGARELAARGAAIGTVNTPPQTQNPVMSAGDRSSLVGRKPQDGLPSWLQAKGQQFADRAKGAFSSRTMEDALPALGGNVGRVLTGVPALTKDLYAGTTFTRATKLKARLFDYLDQGLSNVDIAKNLGIKPNSNSYTNLITRLSRMRNEIKKEGLPDWFKEEMGQ